MDWIWWWICENVNEITVQTCRCYRMSIKPPPLLWQTTKLLLESSIFSKFDEFNFFLILRNQIFIESLYNWTFELFSSQNNLKSDLRTRVTNLNEMDQNGYTYKRKRLTCICSTETYSGRFEIPFRIFLDYTCNSCISWHMKCPLSLSIGLVDMHFKVYH